MPVPCDPLSIEANLEIRFNPQWHHYHRSYHLWATWRKWIICAGKYFAVCRKNDHQMFNYICTTWCECKLKIFLVSSGNIFVPHLEIDVGVGRSPTRSLWAVTASWATHQPAQAVSEGRPELLELHGVDEGVNGGVGVAKPEHEARPAVRKGDL